MKNWEKSYFTRCKWCKTWIKIPTSKCPKCKEDIDRQFSNISDEELKKLFES